MLEWQIYMTFIVRLEYKYREEITMDLLKTIRKYYEEGKMSAKDVIETYKQVLLYGKDGMFNGEVYYAWFDFIFSDSKLYELL